MPSFVRVRLLAIFTLLGLLVAAGGRTANAIVASPHAVELVQPDQTRITLRIRGDERFHWYEDLDGFSVVRDGNKYVYARLNRQGNLVPTSLAVGKGDPRATGLRPGMLPKPVVRMPPRQAVSTRSLSANAEEPPVRISPSGTISNLVVLCRFSDHTFGVHTREQGDYAVLFNAVGGDPTLAPTGSVRDYYLEASYGTMTLDSTVVAWVTLPQTEAYYANGEDGVGTYSYPNNAQGMVEDALYLVDPLVDFGDFDSDNDGLIDAISIIHSGYGAETGGGGGNWIWSHSWSLWALPGGEWTSADTNSVGVNVSVYDYHTEPALWGTSGNAITRIGVICHETGHFFGLPDFYDTDGTSEGIGSWGLMANSWGFDGSQLYPPHFCAFSKISLGWLTPTVITDGTYSAPQVETNPTVFKVVGGYPVGEYLLIENRQPAGFETAIPQGGLAIWHIDENKLDNNDEGYPGQPGWPGNNRHYRVALLQADGNYNLEKNHNRGDSGDVYHAGAVAVIDNGTVPSTDAYQNGIILDTGNSISGISSAGSSMAFDFLGPSPRDIIYETDFTGGLPAGWSIVDGGSDGRTWTSTNPGGRSSVYWNGEFMIVDSDWAGSVNMDEELVTDIIDCSNYENITLAFKHDFRWYFQPPSEICDVDIRVNGGSWQNLARYTNGNASGVVNLDISAIADGQANVQIRWHYYDANYDWYWGIDDVVLLGVAVPSLGITVTSGYPDPKVWNIGPLNLEDIVESLTFTVENTGNVSENITIKGSHGINGWQLADAVGQNAFMVEVDKDDDDSYETFLSATEERDFADNVPVSGTETFGLRYNAPDEDTLGGGVPQSFTVTVKASVHVE